MNKTLRSTLNKVIYFSVRQPEAAKRLASLLVKSPNDSLILPFLDYPKGPLSKEILCRDFKSLTVCERDEETRQLFHVSSCRDLKI